jgi:Rad3-related DNA helicase
MLNLQDEISRTAPIEVEGKSYRDGIPIMYAFECALLELETDSGYTYTAVNYINGHRAELCRSKKPMAVNEDVKFAELIRNSNAGGASRYQIDRPVGEKLSLAKALEILRYIFTIILPQHGYTIREGQLELAEHILKSLVNGTTSLVEAGTGFGKSEAYIIPLIIVKRGRMNDGRNITLYPEMQYADMPKLAAVITTSSIALQKSVVREYIPKLSGILLKHGIINNPLIAVLRKGREHYVCHRNLREQLIFVSNPKLRRRLEELLKPNSQIDLAEIAGLSDVSAFLKKRICVPVRCDGNCLYKRKCQYLALREQANSLDIDIQVCNHNYLLADTLNRTDGKSKLIPNYQLLVVDEAHKFANAARDMYSSELSSQSAKQIINTVDSQKFVRVGTTKLAMNAAKKLRNTSERLFLSLRSTIVRSDDNEYLSVTVDSESARQLTNLRDIAERLLTILRDEMFGAKAKAILNWVRERYKVNTNGVNLTEILEIRTDTDDTREQQIKLHTYQATALHREICKLPGIAFHIQNEQGNQHEPRFGINPEKYLLRQEFSSVTDTIWREIERTMLSDSGYCKGSEGTVSLMWTLGQLRDCADTLSRFDEHIYWLERENGENTLCATPKNLPERLYANQWKKGISTILTSGTLSASGDFGRAKQTLGLTKLGPRVTEISKQSPYNYRDNCLLYMPEKFPFPDPKSEWYLAAVTDEIEKLIRTSNGHTAVLFTGYSVMGTVYKRLEQRGLPFPMFKLEKSTSNAIERFKQSGNGVLFASGALWEGIDIPGDALSMLIVVKLPFAVPDALGEYERTQYPNFAEYFENVIIPDMLVKFKQGFGRLIRTEIDTGVVALFDCRAFENNAYYAPILSAIPDVRVTQNINDVETHLQTVKPIEYWQ